MDMLLARAKQVYRTEGLMPLVRRSLAYVLGHLLRHETYYLLEHDTARVWDFDEADFLPRIERFSLRIISTNYEADELEVEGYEFRSQIPGARERLEKGAIAFCIFVGRELANIGWIALSEEAMRTLHSLPHKVNFSGNESCTGASMTKPKYEGNRLMTYSLFKRWQFLNERGIKTDRAMVARNNTASLVGSTRLSPKVYAEARYLKILCWSSWTEKPLVESPYGQSLMR